MTRQISKSGAGLGAGLIISIAFSTAIRATLIGSACVAAYTAFFLLSGTNASGLTSLGGALLMLGGVAIIAIITGFLFTSLVVMIFGVPTALLLGERISQTSGLVAALSAAIVASIAAAFILEGVLVNFSEAPLLSAALVLCYAVPVSIFFQQELVSNHMIGE